MCQTKAAIVLLLLFLAGCKPAPEPVIQISGATMGTTYHVTLVNPGELRADELKRDLDFQLEHFNTIASTYIGDSELNRLNRAAVGEWHDISPVLYAILNMAIEVSWLSGGAFDITVAPLVNLWGFGPQKHEYVPDQAGIDAAMALVGYQKLEMDMLEPKMLKREAVQLDLSAIAKGYGVDATAVWLASLGVTDYLVEIGGEMRMAGKSPRGDSWRIGVENPDPDAEGVLPVAVTDMGVATSGDYRNYFEKDGKRYSHTIDPRTGRPITHRLASVTVLDPSCAYADALATAFSVMGGDAALAMANSQDIPIYLIEKTDEGFVSRYSDAFAPYLEEQ
ncbi:FAD:protein FMN transferase [Spongiibacter taiwanensis]|uniref:FAD:protein FMN transferase n=1 Tax=Spongiibacter taiwanensis TaxID=1748242 RepID=UPI0020354A18|nr:FAD:protein FMN transferase [Spongiibacter taiwanensis]USA43524.1 FAD:protein FMN transferase [Spongiibacter taiwanensis]